MGVSDITPCLCTTFVVDVFLRWDDRFYHGCSTFLPVFDASMDTYDGLHERSPFAVDVICMVAAKVRDGGGKSRLKHL